ncbi:heterokaryon incompatibility protein-domain-containing protein [Apiosordaria backusii]|uniref:Heterokaryon incompatibility protein-domain-containing protein n=1 Tax=Apiosordaria backusii TaxID=314023 RepID=A0AA40E377_9PEZI|nr:heterokaryon incompatibility protein-domain-containing protein [Apiosordaria backusii]
MPYNAAGVVASVSHHYNHKPTKRIGSPHERVRIKPFGQQQIVSNDQSRRRDAERDSAPAHFSVLGKRRLEELDESRESTAGSNSSSNPAAKRHCRISLSSPTNQLCTDCSKICWDGIEKLIKEKLRFTWKGRPVADVGWRYRKLSPDNTCALCRQLYAPWIEKFLENRRWIERKVINDMGDRIHVFPNLRYVHHISDFQAGRNVLREHEAPYHIAVVPIAPRWREGLLEHIAARGLVVVLPDGRSESKILQPQQVSPKYDARLVLSWLRTCRHHRSRCNPKPPEVKGMRVIDCKSEHLAIVDYQPCDEYVALSYVWGQSGGTGPTEDSAPRGTMKLPRNIPLTIRDAIEVTKALRYRYLWVDKYCIDQNNENEQREQFSRMGDIYAGSQVAIFALGDDSNAGLPGVSSTPRVGQQECRSGRYRFISTMPDPHEFIKRSKWSTRAWTYQEGLFSTRRLFFTNHQVYFECNAMNCAESFKSNLGIIHTNNGQRFRAYHRAGQFVCGNSNQYSHLDVRRNKANHRKVDMIRRCQHQISQYTKRELTNKDDVLHAFAAIARFYAKTTAMIASLAGIPIPFPIANLPTSNKQEGLDHLSYALAWSHQVDNFDDKFPRQFCETQPEASEPDRLQQLPWTPDRNPKPQRRPGFPSWSWAGWFGQIRSRNDLPYCWTSLLSSVRIGFGNSGHMRDYEWLQGFERYKQYFIRELLTAESLHFDAYVLSPEKLISRRHLGEDVCLSMGPTSLEELQMKLMRGEYQCVVLGTYGEPRRDVYRAIQAADRKTANAKKRRIDMFERREPDAIVCLLVRTNPVEGFSYRRGLLKVPYYHRVGGENALQGWDTGPMRSFILR